MLKKIKNNLIEMGYDKVFINKIYLYFESNNINTAFGYLNEKD